MLEEVKNQNEALVLHIEVETLEQEITELYLMSIGNKVDTVLSLVLKLRSPPPLRHRMS